MVKRIEFMGIPGSGKTTLSNLVQTELSVAGKEIHSFQNLFRISLEEENKRLGIPKYLRFVVINKLLRDSYIPLKTYNKHVIDFIVNNNEVWQSLINLTLSNEDIERRKFIIKDLMKVIARWGIITDNNKESKCIVMDEGFSHRIAAMSISKSKDNISSDLEKIFFCLGYPDLVVNLTCDVRDSVARMTKRKTGVPESFRMLSESDLEIKLNRMSEFSKYLIPLLEKGGTKVITVENKNMDAAKRVILKELSNI